MPARSSSLQLVYWRPGIRRGDTQQRSACCSGAAAGAQQHRHCRRRTRSSSGCTGHGRRQFFQKSQRSDALNATSRSSGHQFVEQVGGQIVRRLKSGFDGGFGEDAADRRRLAQGGAPGLASISVITRRCRQSRFGCPLALSYHDRSPGPVVVRLNMSPAVLRAIKRRQGATGRFSIRSSSAMNFSSGSAFLPSGIVICRGTRGQLTVSSLRAPLLSPMVLNCSSGNLAAMSLIGGLFRGPLRARPGYWVTVDDISGTRCRRMTSSRTESTARGLNVAARATLTRSPSKYRFHYLLYEAFYSMQHRANRPRC